MDIDKKEFTDYFRNNIFEAISAYTLWQCIKYSRSSGVVSPQLSEKYVTVQNYHVSFFKTVENTALVTFIILILHAFDKDDRSYSLFKVEKEKTEAFVKENQTILDQLFLVRNKALAHKDIEANNYFIPPPSEIDKFFENLIKLYNELTKTVDKSMTYFSNASDIRFDIEHLFMNLQRGEVIRKSEIEIEWDWEKDEKVISKQIKDFK